MRFVLWSKNSKLQHNKRAPSRKIDLGFVGEDLPTHVGHQSRTPMKCAL